MEFQYGRFGGQFVPPQVAAALQELEQAFNDAKNDPTFIEEYLYYLKQYVGRPSPLYFAQQLTKKLGGAKIYLKREDLNHTGAHKINNTIGQILLAKRMGKTKIIAETGAGQHGVATATAAAMFNMECEIFQGQIDMERQRLNVFRMEMLGAKVTGVTQGTKTLADAVDYAINEWIKRIDDTFYLLGSAVGPHPYPTIVRFFQKIIGEEAKKQIIDQEGRLPDVIMACVGGGSNAIGLFADFIDDKDVKIIGVEAAGMGLETKDHAATLTLGKESIIHGMNTKAVVEEDGSISPVYSISAGLDYPGVGPEHAFLQDIKRAEYVAVTDKEAVDAFLELSQVEGIIPAIESSHAVAYAMKLAPKMSKDHVLIINLSGRGDKDVEAIERYLQ
ncbi:tryptophan synthase subunit beta [Candidatus Xianfuyuplasma coldseepsis]|uniref:Tryptophan synthase beta chain n=1 Tax=Candidatus Xianfuyuplasma coldseepsis TaxID=2782163 RepID=A0A7L7KQ21_9MOLU|nr:tryptophan synthase subunit beta [Xianfuyuplasma coldseepsis]QMS84777.1 tryptophan synthase subunit beta [Xianfuyuplasma coldseepsis]